MLKTVGAVLRVTTGQTKCGSVHLEIVDFVPKQGRTKVSTAGVAALRRG
jgi:hypothetical protein